jgi:hypothetical protein
VQMATQEAVEIGDVRVLEAADHVEQC